MDTNQLKSSSKFAWILVLALGFMSAGTGGTYSVVVGCFMTPVCEDLGIDYTMFSYYFTGTLLGLALALPLAGKVMDKVVGKIWLSAVCAVLVSAGAAMSFYTEVWQFWISSAIIGICFSFTTGVAMSSVIDQWFLKRAGLAIGLAWSVTSVYMLVMSPIMTEVIIAIGWRTSFLVLALVAAVMVFPATLLIIRYKPSDWKMLPYGYEQGDKLPEQTVVEAAAESGVPFKIAVRSPAFFLCILFLCVLQVTVCMNQLFPTFAVEVGFAPIVGGFMVSAASFADLFLNVLVGSSCDKFGSQKAILAWIGVSIASFVMLIFSIGNAALAITAAGINDVMYVIAGAGLTCMVMEIFGSKDFGRIFALICSCGYIVGSFGMPIMTSVYELAGDFQAVFGFCIILNVFTGIFLVAAKKAGKKLPWEGRAELATADGVTSENAGSAAI